MAEIEGQRRGIFVGGERKHDQTGEDGEYDGQQQLDECDDSIAPCVNGVLDEHRVETLHGQ